MNTRQMILNQMLMKCGLDYGSLTIYPNRKNQELDVDFRNHTHGVRFSMPSEALTMPLDSLGRWLDPAVSAFKLQVSAG